jgi:Metallo-peptidase family M12B Reprolysin-like
VKAGTTTTTSTTTQPTPLAAGKVDTVITLYATYSPGYVLQYGTEALARLRISNIVQVANAAYANSGTGIQFRIVGWQNVAQANTTPQTSLPALRGGTGAFSTVPANRKNAGAAMTVFFSPFNTTTGATGTCGLGYMPGASSQGLNIFKAQATSAMFSVVNDGQYNGYYCETLTTAHELGHNLGNAHDKANSSTSGVFAYSYGKGVSGSFGTVMSYISPRVALFSSPQLKCGSAAQPCGTTAENVVATMLQTKSVVAALGNTTKASLASTGFNLVSGWLLNASGAPYTAAGVTVRATPSTVTCTTGKTGLYVCQAPSAVTSFTVSAVATGKSITPSQGTVLVAPSANTPVNGTRFYIK